MADQSLATTKRNIGLAYGDVGLVGMQIIRCLEYELAQRDNEIAALNERVARLEDEL